MNPALWTVQALWGVSFSLTGPEERPLPKSRGCQGGDRLRRRTEQPEDPVDLGLKACCLWTSGSTRNSPVRSPIFYWRHNG